VSIIKQIRKLNISEPVVREPRLYIYIYIMTPGKSLFYKYNLFGKYEVTTVIKIHAEVFWDVTPCIAVIVGPCYLQVHPKGLLVPSPQFRIIGLFILNAVTGGMMWKETRYFRIRPSL